MHVNIAKVQKRQLRVLLHELLCLPRQNGDFFLHRQSQPFVIGYFVDRDNIRDCFEQVLKTYFLEIVKWKKYLKFGESVIAEATLPTEVMVVVRYECGEW